jgi:hypothetical protein
MERSDPRPHRTTGRSYDPGYAWDLWPTDADIEEWGRAEHERRQAWLAGPSQIERQEWALSQLRRSTSGGPEGSYGPTDEEVENWARDEHDRRAAWAAGPSEVERLEWALRVRERDPLARPVTDADIEAWVKDEHARREAWLAGPTEAERADWARRAGAARYAPAWHAGPEWRPSPAPCWEDRVRGAVPDPVALDRMRHDGRLAMIGALTWLTESPWRTWEQLVDAGKRWEDGMGEPRSRRRIRLYEQM